MILFFKQKTAYEVRISDWSSDVFSSDLHDWLRRCPDSWSYRRDAPRRRLRTRWCWRGLGRRRNWGRNPPRHNSRDRRTRCRDPPRRTGAVLRDDARKRGRDGDCRSEEHTSEIQSQMSTLYAVIGLKKRKNKTKS